MLAEERAAAVCACVVGPEEYEHAERYHIVVGNVAVGSGIECEHVDGREGQGDVHLSEHGVSPAVYRVLRLHVKLADEEIYYCKQIWYEHGTALNHSAAEASYGKKEIYTGNSAYKAVYLYALYVVHQSAVFPYRQSCYESKQKLHGDGSHEAYHDGCHKEHARDASYNKVLHLVTHISSILFLENCHCRQKCRFQHCFQMPVPDLRRCCQSRCFRAEPCRFRLQS